MHSIEIANYNWQQKSPDYKKTDHFKGWNTILSLKTGSAKLFIENQHVYLSNSFDPTRSENGIPLPANVDHEFNAWSVEYQSNVARLFNFSSQFSYGIL